MHSSEQSFCLLISKIVSHQYLLFTLWRHEVKAGILSCKRLYNLCRPDMCSTSVTVWPLYPDKNIILTAPGISSFSVTTLLCSTYQQFHTNSLMFETVWLAENDCEAGRVWCWIISWWLWIICPLSREMDLFHIIWTHLDQLTATTNDDCDLSVDCQVLLLQSFAFKINNHTSDNQSESQTQGFYE